MTYLIGSGVRARMAARRLRADARAAAGIDHGDAVTPDDEARVGDVALVARREQLVASLVHENAGRDLLDGERLGRGGAGRGHTEKGSGEEGGCREKTSKTGACEHAFWGLRSATADTHTTVHGAASAP